MNVSDSATITLLHAIPAFFLTYHALTYIIDDDYKTMIMIMIFLTVSRWVYLFLL